MKRSSIIIKSILCMLMAGIGNHTLAQKAENTQQGSMQAPAGIKTDGKLTEWGAPLQAYNKTTKVWYTLANDTQKIYLAIKCTDQNTINKILSGGISFSINTADKKKDKDAYVITFPMINRTGGGGRGNKMRGFGQQQDTPDSAAILAQHRETLATSKTISAIGFKEITDTLISIYNEYGIKAAATFDDKGNFNYELSIPLKMLGITASPEKEIAYNIKLNGLQFGGSGMVMIGGGGRNGGGLSLSGFDGGGGFGGRGKSDMEDMMSPTDFWAKYTLYTK